MSRKIQKKLLTAFQLKILKGILKKKSERELAKEFSCSIMTISRGFSTAKKKLERAGLEPRSVRNPWVLKSRLETFNAGIENTKEWRKKFWKLVRESKEYHQRIENEKE